MKNLISRIVILQALFLCVIHNGRAQEFNDPITTTDWNTVWKSSFLQSNNGANAPESSGWFWGINMNHSSNTGSYRYNGQIAIKNYSTNPTIYFRSTNVNGSGTWAKILHNKGNQSIGGVLTVDKDSNLGQITTRSVSYSTNRVAGINYKIDNVNLWQTITDNSEGNRFFIQYLGDKTKRYLTIESGGNIGVNTLNPNYEFVVTGNNGINQYIIGNSGTGQNIETLQGNILLMRNLNTGAYNAGSSLAFGTGSSKELVWAAVEGLYTGWTSGNHGGDLRFLTKKNNTSALSEHMRITKAGKIGIGTASPDAKLTVKGAIHSEEIKVEAVGADFVFAPNYNLMPLQEIEAFVKQNHHLPEVPSATEMEANGVELGKMNMLLLQKIEELTLLMIQQQKQLENQNSKIETQNTVISTFIKNQEK